MSRSGTHGRRGRFRGATQSGFTLIELLLVLVILTILAAVVVPKFARRSQQANMTAAHTEIAILGGCLDAFEIDNGRFPTTEEGFRALIEQPSGLQNWHGPYKGLGDPKDPWGNVYVYQSPGQHNTSGYDVLSLGPDGKEGGGDDIDNWSPR